MRPFRLWAGIQSALELHPQRTNTVIQIIFEPLLKPCTDGMLARVRASSRGVLVDGAGVAPAPLCYAHRRSGSPWVPVRPYYEGPPSKEGQYGSDEGRRKSPGSRGMKVPWFGPDEHGPGVEAATVECREAACPQGTWPPSTRSQTRP